jgi:BTB/POZ domain-containing protein 7
LIRVQFLSNCNFFATLQIGRFLELDILAQGCEDVIVDNLCLDNLPQVLRWSELPHGSPWVRRQALHLLREEFASVAQAGVLLELDKAHLIEALQSDFLQVCVTPYWV